MPLLDIVKSGFRGFPPARAKKPVQTGRNGIKQAETGRNGTEQALTGRNWLPNRLKQDGTGQYEQTVIRL
jgi:hypothetical protein